MVSGIVRRAREFVPARTSAGRSHPSGRRGARNVRRCWRDIPPVVSRAGRSGRRPRRSSGSRPPPSRPGTPPRRPTPRPPRRRCGAITSAINASPIRSTSGAADAPPALSSAPPGVAAAVRHRSISRASAIIRPPIGAATSGRPVLLDEHGDRDRRRLGRGEADEPRVGPTAAAELGRAGLAGGRHAGHLRAGRERRPSFLDGLDYGLLMAASVGVRTWPWWTVRSRASLRGR